MMLSHVKTIGNDRVRVSHFGGDGVKITFSERGTVYQPGKRFAEVESTIIPAVFVDFVRDAMAEPDGSPTRRTDPVSDLVRRHVAAIESGEPWDSGTLAQEIRKLPGLRP